MKGHPAVVVVVVVVFVCLFVFVFLYVVLNPTIWAAHPILYVNFLPPEPSCRGTQIILI